MEQVYKNIKHISFNDIQNQYTRAKRHIGICLCSDYECYHLRGRSSFEVLNTHSRCPITPNKEYGYIALVNKNRYLGELLFFKSGNDSYLLYTTNHNILKELKKAVKAYPLTVINDASQYYSIFTFHGNYANRFFDNFNAKCLFKTSHQGYTYYHMIVNKKDETRTFNFYLEQQFIPISIETKRIFLYNNKVITNFNNFSSIHKKDLLGIKYPTFKTLSSYTLELFECLDNSIIEKNTKILNYNRKPCGLVYNSFNLPQKKYPFVLGIVNGLNNSVMIIKKEGKEILIRKVFKDYDAL